MFSRHKGLHWKPMAARRSRYAVILAAHSPVTLTKRRGTNSTLLIFVVTRGPISLSLFLHSIAGYKCPKRIQFRDALPFSGAGVGFCRVFALFTRQNELAVQIRKPDVWLG